MLASSTVFCAAVFSTMLGAMLDYLRRRQSLCREPPEADDCKQQCECHQANTAQDGIFDAVLRDYDYRYLRTLRMVIVTVVAVIVPMIVMSMSMSVVVVSARFVRHLCSFLFPDYCHSCNFSSLCAIALVVNRLFLAVSSSFQKESETVTPSLATEKRYPCNYHYRCEDYQCIVLTTSGLRILQHLAGGCRDRAGTVDYGVDNH